MFLLNKENITEIHGGVTEGGCIPDLVIIKVEPTITQPTVTVSGPDA